MRLPIIAIVLIVFAGGLGVAQPATRQVTLHFFLAGGALPARPVTFMLRRETAAMEKLVTEADGHWVLNVAADREPIFRLLIEGDKKSYEATMVIVSLKKGIAHYPVFLRPAVENPAAAYKPGTKNHDEATPPEAREAFAQALKALDAGQAEAALSEFTRAVAIYPKYSGALNQIGMLFYKMNRLDDASVTFLHAASLGDQAPNAYLNLGVALNRRGRYAEAVTVLTNLLEAQPSLTRIRIPLAEALIQIQQWDAAAEILQQGLAEIDNLSPEMQSEVRYMLARTMYREERYKSAARELTRALESPAKWANAANAYLLLGSAQYELQQDSESEKALVKSVEIGGRAVPTAHFMLGKLYYRQKRYEPAEKELQQFLRETVDSTSVREATQLLEKIKAETRKN